MIAAQPGTLGVLQVVTDAVWLNIPSVILCESMPLWMRWIACRTARRLHAGTTMLACQRA